MPDYPHLRAVIDGGAIQPGPAIRQEAEAALAEIEQHRDVMPGFPNLQALVDGKDAARWPALREEAEAALAELKRLHRVYNVFEEASPPGDQKAFAERCFAAEAEKCELEQAWDYLFGDQWTVKLHHNAGDRVLAIGRRLSDRSVTYGVALTPAKAIIQLATVVAESQEHSEPEGA